MLAVVPSVGALSADYVVLPNGTSYRASVEVTDAARYEFADVGFMGESVPVQVDEVQLSGNCSPCRYNWSRPWGGPAAIVFEKGNYTVSFLAPLRDNNLQAAYLRPYNVTVTLPQEFDVRNPLLAGLSQGANVTRHADNTTTVEWKKTPSFNVRFYTPEREELLWFFLQFMGILILVLVIIPYVLSMKKQE